MNNKQTLSINNTFSIRIDDIMIDCDDAQKLGDFYADLLGWNKTELGKNCVSVHSPDHPLRLLCQQENDYIPPVWPETVDTQQKMLHIDFTVSNLQVAVSHAISLGAKVAEKQYNPTQWITMLDPSGHPFCLCLPE
ncbi:VOC family protein|uniref:Catechol 2,3-dioxygenase n=1 Tax=Dendrosporobacter quercicolus TaxID=146817 RepID=A0A1G9NUD2_9FIRM|nr:VOC family protein [Dendrosporobacter quercicolus]NSL47443.1 VOC family protein [Dendrosporobacter quercicolus DSM 1736]SDL89647.1 Catechol 2,3-dioxygenase [Dendrosporobacter quercicolus]